MSSREAAVVEEWLDSLDPATVQARDAIHHRRVIAARKQVDETRDELGRAVAQARAAGESWAAIGMALGISRQAAQQRFGG